MMYNNNLNMASVSGAHSSRTVIDVIPQFPKSKVEIGSVRLRPILNAASSSAGGLGGSVAGLSGVDNVFPSRFPKLEECAHFHYDNVELPAIRLSALGKDEEGLRLEVTSGNESWTLVRSYQHFVKLDEQLHKCVFARSYSHLPDLSSANKDHCGPLTEKSLESYVERLDAAMAGWCVSCGPVLTWLELDNRGRRLVASGHGINTPAVAAAFATSTYRAAASDELSFQIGDMISVIDMPPSEESVWWRGKRGFLVGFFPSHCVAVITGKIPSELNINEPTKPVLRKHGKLIAFFRAFILSRPSRRRLKQSGILKERVFGCDLSEHLLNSSREIPLVLKCCADFIESYGIVDGIYRLSGVTSNIQKLRSTFDEDRVPPMMEEPSIKQDIHSVASLLKMYFRELPNPLCTYQLYDEFVAAVQAPPLNRLTDIIAVVNKLPPPHYRTLEYLIGHLSKVSEHAAATGMTARNVAIVWAPNLLRSKSLGVAALQGVGVQALVTEFLVINYQQIFKSDSQTDCAGTSGSERPKSLMVSSPTKLLSLEEAQARQSPAGTTVSSRPTELPLISSSQPNERIGDSDFTDNQDHPVRYHTVLELPRKRQPLNWRTLFTPLSKHSGGKTSTGVGSAAVSSTTSSLKHKVSGTVKSAENVNSCIYGARGCNNTSGNTSGIASKASCHIAAPSSSTHSRSVSHDSYFDTAAAAAAMDQPSSSSNTHPGMSLSLDLSELQMNFDISESDMKMFSEDDTNLILSSSLSGSGAPSDEAGIADRFSAHELRYIDSYSPDPPDNQHDPTLLGYMPLPTPSSSELIKSAATESVTPPYLCEDALGEPNTDPSSSLLATKASTQVSSSATAMPFSSSACLISEELNNVTAVSSNILSGTESVNAVSCLTSSPATHDDFSGYERLDDDDENENHCIRLESSGDIIVSAENNLYESVDDDGTTEVSSNSYENQRVLTSSSKPAVVDNIYEDIQLSTTQDIYEQVSYLRTSVDQVNRLVDSNQGSLQQLQSTSFDVTSSSDACLKRAKSVEKMEKTQMDKNFDFKKLSNNRTMSSDDHHVYEPVCSGPNLLHFTNMSKSCQPVTTSQGGKSSMTMLTGAAVEDKPSPTIHNVSVSYDESKKLSSSSCVSPAYTNQDISLSEPVKSCSENSLMDIRSDNLTMSSAANSIELLISEQQASQLCSKVPRCENLQRGSVQGPCTDAPYGTETDYENISFSMPCSILAKQNLHLDSLCPNNGQDRSCVISSEEGHQQLPKKNSVDQKFSCVVVSELLKCDISKSAPTSVDPVNTNQTVDITMESQTKNKTEKLRKMFEQDVKKSDDVEVGEGKKDATKSPIQEKCEFFQSKEQPVCEGQGDNTIWKSNRSESANKEPKIKNNEKKLVKVDCSPKSSPVKKDESPKSVKVSQYEKSIKLQSSEIPSPQKCSSIFTDESKKHLTETKIKTTSAASSTSDNLGSPSKTSASTAVRKFEPLNVKSHPQKVDQGNLLTPSPESPIDSFSSALTMASGINHLGESEAERRERIEKYKEERRMFFRNKYKIDNNNDDDDDLIRRIKERRTKCHRMDSTSPSSPTILD